MELDFSELESIATQTATNEFTEPLGAEEGNYTQEAEKPARNQNRAPCHQLDNEQRERARIREMYSQYQENIKRAGGLRSEILKGVQGKEDPLSLLLKAVRCISYMTGDTVIYSQCKEDVVTAYGYSPEERGTE